jgi:hypothetical protein
LGAITSTLMSLRSSGTTVTRRHRILDLDVARLRGRSGETPPRGDEGELKTHLRSSQSPEG